jgi:hypothetical protein
MDFPFLLLKAMRGLSRGAADRVLMGRKPVGVNGVLWQSVAAAKMPPASNIHLKNTGDQFIAHPGMSTKLA